jgi:hypothetical protein
MTKKKKVYGNELDEPLEPMQIGLLAHDDDRAPKISERVKEESRRLDLLSEHYGLDQGDYFALALALAREFVPGLQDKKRGRGAPKKWGEIEMALLYADVQRTIEERQLSSTDVREACQHLAQSPAWSAFVGRSEGKNRDADPAEALRSAYYAAVKSSIRTQKITNDLCLKLYHQLVLDGSVAEWDREVEEMINSTNPQ